MDYKKLYKEYKLHYLKLKYGLIGGTNFTLFNKKERNDIMNEYNKIIKGKKKCTDYPIDNVLDASRGMYIYPKDEIKENQKQLCASIKQSHKKKKNPIVHENSLTAWGNQAAEQFGLEIKDILKMKPGEKIRVLLLDRNVGDYTHGFKKGKKYDPKKIGLTYADYTHKKGLTGKLNMYEIDIVHDDFQWEINQKAIGGPFWGPIPKNMDWKNLDKRTKVGWRGPAIRESDAKKLPKQVTHYNTWWDDYMPFRTFDFLIERN